MPIDGEEPVASERRRGDWAEYRRSIVDSIDALREDAKERRKELLELLQHLEARLSDQLRLTEGRLERRLHEAAANLTGGLDRAEGDRVADQTSLENRIEFLDRSMRTLERRVTVLRARAALFGSGFGAILGALAGAVASRIFRA